MSRIGREPIEIPSGVDVMVGDDALVTVKGPRGSLSQRMHTEGFIVGFEPEGEGLERVLRVQLKYSAKRERAIGGLKRVSKPGRRLYSGRHQLPRVLGGLGIAIVSTSQGVMTDRDASRYPSEYRRLVRDYFKAVAGGK